MAVLGRTVGDDLLADLADRGLPLVTMARDPLPGADAVNAENEHSAAALARDLVGDHGYRLVRLPRRRRHLAGHPGRAGRLPPCSARGAGACATAAGRLPVRRGGGSRHARRRLLRRQRPRALVCANDEIALGAVTAAEELGLRVPDDLAITGWDDVMAARHSRPGLTTVRQPMRELGAWAARRLHRRLAGDMTAPRHEVLPTQLVRRASCGHHPEEDR